MATVKLPTILRKFTSNEARVSAKGATLRDVLGDLETRYPGITKNVLADDGGLHRFINVYVNDATQFLAKPLVYGSIYQWEGQATVFMPGKETPCYRCLFPSPPPPGTVPSCAEGGVFGVLPGVIGSIQATEAIKLLTGEGETLEGRLLLYDALHMSFEEVKIRWDADCPVCGKDPSITELIDYEAFCGVPARPE